VQWLFVINAKQGYYEMTQKTAFVFPGQGSQSVGMLSDFDPQYPIVIQTFAEASEAIGYDIWALIQQGPEQILNQTERTQVAMLTADVAIYRLLREEGINAPQFMAGHSLGEYAALVAADALAFTDAVRLVEQRGRLMQCAMPIGVGSMAAIIGLSDDEVEDLCRIASLPEDEVTPANYNAVGQVVVAGHTTAVKRLLALAEGLDARLAKMIPVSVPCHCSLLRAAADEFGVCLQSVDFNTPSIPVISNVDLSTYVTGEEIRIRLKEQLYSPVRWVETIQLFKNKGVEWIIECGPGKVLHGLIKRIDRSFNTASVYDTISLEQLIDKL
jgi:[acyl-carrier-protein] S-malonyltransferase